MFYSEADAPACWAQGISGTENGRIYCNSICLFWLWHSCCWESGQSYRWLDQSRSSLCAQGGLDLVFLVLEIQNAMKGTACFSFSIGMFLFTESLRLENTSEMESISCFPTNWAICIGTLGPGFPLLFLKLWQLDTLEREFAGLAVGKAVRWVRGCLADCQELSRVTSTAWMWVTKKGHQSSCCAENLP